MDAIPLPLVRLGELQQENKLLRQEVQGLRRRLDTNNAQPRPEFPPDTYTLHPDDRRFQHKVSQHKMSEVGSVYGVCYRRLSLTHPLHRYLS